MMPCATVVGDLPAFDLNRKQTFGANEEKIHLSRTLVLHLVESKTMETDPIVHFRNFPQHTKTFDFCAAGYIWVDAGWAELRDSLS